MSRRLKLGLLALVLLLAAGATGVWWFLRDDAPADVSIDRAVESVDDDTATVDDIAGTWRVDAETGEFDYESATGTFVGFRVKEKLAGVGDAEAVGRTGEVTGSATIEGTTLTDASFEVDMTSITTNESRRDDKVQGALETDEFPTATFELTDPVDLGERAEEGVEVVAKGELTVHGVTKRVEIPLEARLAGSTIVVVGSVGLVFSDYGVTVPSAPIVLSADDHGVLELQLLLVEG